MKINFIQTSEQLSDFTKQIWKGSRFLKILGAILVTLFILPTILIAQSDNFLTDTTFFQNQTQLYQKWLDNSGLGKTLKVQTLGVYPDELALYLAFQYTATDSITEAW